MYILAIETTGAFASAALMKDGDIIGHVAGHDRFSHLQNLMPQIRQVLQEGDVSLEAVDVIAVSCGPGSFTGIRIGVSSARALSQITGKPCEAVSSLAALAMRAGEYHERAEDIERGKILICPMLDARRNQIYAGGYLMEDGYPKELIKAGPYMLDEFLSESEEYDRILLLGDALDAYSEQIRSLRFSGTETAPESIRYQDAASVAKLALRQYEKNGGITYDQLKPDYMRMAEAERKLKERHKKI